MMVKFCPERNCGAINENNAIWCKQCGNQIITNKQLEQERTRGEPYYWMEREEE